MLPLPLYFAPHRDRHPQFLACDLSRGVVEAELISETLGSKAAVARHLVRNLDGGVRGRPYLAFGLAADQPHQVGPRRQVKDGPDGSWLPQSVGQRIFLEPQVDYLLDALQVMPVAIEDAIDRSEERRVGKECRSRWSPYH